MKHVIIANPRSGRGRGQAALAVVEASFRSRSVDCQTMITTGPGDATSQARKAADSGCDVLVVLGGDGTLFEAVNGVMAATRRPRIAIVPVGTGNSFCKDLGIETLDQGLAALEGGVTRPVDLGRGKAEGHEGFWFINLTGAGFVARVARRAQSFKFLGDLAYTIAVFIELPGLKAQRLDIVADGQASSREAIFVEICNSRKTGGDMIMAPEARIDDGLFDVIVAKAMSRRSLLSLFPLIFTGEHIKSPLVEIFTCKKIEARFERPEPVTPDGELIGQSPLSAEIHPSALEFYAL